MMNYKVQGRRRRTRRSNN